MLISSVSGYSKVIHLHVNTYTLLFGFSARVGRCGVLRKIPRAVRWALAYLLYIQCCVGVNPNLLIYHSLCYPLVTINLFSFFSPFFIFKLWKYEDTFIGDSENAEQSYILLLFTRSTMSDSLRPHGLQHARLPCLSPTPRACSNSRPLSWWCHPTISSSVAPFSSHLQSFPASGSFSRSQFFTLWPKY